MSDLDGRLFPMVDGPSIPWALAEQIYSLYTEAFGHDQSLDVIAERGGFYWAEVPHICNVLEQRGKQPPFKRPTTDPRNWFATRAHSFYDLSREVYKWAKAMFPDATAHTITAHMKKEVDELAKADTPEDEALELADIQMLLIDYAGRKNIDLLKNCWDKLAIVRTREWVIQPEGHFEHKR